VWSCQSVFARLATGYRSDNWLHGIIFCYRKQFFSSKTRNSSKTRARVALRGSGSLRSGRHVARTRTRTRSTPVLTIYSSPLRVTFRKNNDDFVYEQQRIPDEYIFNITARVVRPRPLQGFSSMVAFNFQLRRSMTKCSKFSSIIAAFFQKKKSHRLRREKTFGACSKATVGRQV